jgi:hypothetical protein
MAVVMHEGRQGTGHHCQTDQHQPAMYTSAADDHMSCGAAEAAEAAVTVPHGLSAECFNIRAPMQMLGDCASSVKVCRLNTPQPPQTANPSTPPPPKQQTPQPHHPPKSKGTLPHQASLEGLQAGRTTPPTPVHLAVNTALLLYSSCQRPSTGAGLPAKGSPPAPDASRERTSASILSRCAAVARVPRSRAASSDSSSSFVAFRDDAEGWKGVGAAGAGAGCAGALLLVPLPGLGSTTAVSGLEAARRFSRGACTEPLEVLGTCPVALRHVAAGIVRVASIVVLLQEQR